MISEARNKIDKLDAQLVKLFEQRLDIIAEIAYYKKQHNLTIIDPIREQEILYRVKQLLKNQEYAPLITQLFECLVAITKSYQQNYIKDK